ncbi:Uncharacterised protein [Bordetella pertussis]|nr:Uncharacterised protein [Bordetella pertussis]CFW47630.1 Uncharacterised protein [Bordetella pertussis]
MRTDTAPTPCSNALSTAIRMACATTGWPRPPMPSSKALAVPSRTSRGCASMRSVPARSLSS